MLQHGGRTVAWPLEPIPKGFGFCLRLIRQVRAWRFEHLCCQGRIVAFIVVLGAVPVAAQNVEDLPDLTGGAVPILVYETRDPFSSEEPTSIEHVQFSVRIKNQTGDPVIGDSLILIVDKIVALSGEDVLHRITVVGADGYTDDGKPYFRVPIANGPDLAPFAESEPLTLKLRNPDYLRFFPPILRVRGIRRSPEKSVQHLLETLVEKGILTPEEAQEALAPLTPTTP